MPSLEEKTCCRIMEESSLNTIGVAVVRADGQTRLFQLTCPTFGSSANMNDGSGHHYSTQVQ